MCQPCARITIDDEEKRCRWGLCTSIFCVSSQRSVSSQCVAWFIRPNCSKLARCMFNTSQCDMVGPGESCEIECAAPYVMLGNATMGQCPMGNSIPCLGKTVGLNWLSTIEHYWRLSWGFDMVVCCVGRCRWNVEDYINNYCFWYFLTLCTVFSGTFVELGRLRPLNISQWLKETDSSQFTLQQGRRYA